MIDMHTFPVKKARPFLSELGVLIKGFSSSFLLIKIYAVHFLAIQYSYAYPLLSHCLVSNETGEVKA